MVLYMGRSCLCRHCLLLGFYAAKGQWSRLRKTAAFLPPFGLLAARVAQRALCAYGLVAGLRPLRWSVSPGRYFSSGSGPWPVTKKGREQTLTLQMIDPDRYGANAHAADVTDLAPGKPGLFPFIVHDAHCTQARQRNPGARKRANDAHQAAPWGLTGYFLDPGLFELLARTSRLQLPAERLHVLWCTRHSSTSLCALAM